ncbi:isoprenylcysteine carboxylmethyltransferase family protein [Gymnodinialimonas sp. 2305UL16-5]|uniref:methyltransferase family protein n=1 Tax=Gymnodinialimonas mytili TaxID=3126503 RepID=UPI0030952632
MKGFPDLPPLWLLAFMALAWLLARFLPLASVESSALRLAGIVLACAAIALIGWSAWWFWRKRTTIEPHHVPGTLIVEGPYRISRNPIYLAFIGILAAQVIWLGAVSAIVTLPALVWVLTERFAKPEERALIQAFGAEADAYLSATGRWV